MLFVELKNKLKKPKRIDEIQQLEPESDPSWLQNKISVEDAEAQHMVEIEDQNIPFGYNYNQWKTLLGIMQDGDELYEFCSSDQSWEYLAGREGIALVRNGEIIADILTIMN